jgi:hypothetical protein
VRSIALRVKRPDRTGLPNTTPLSIYWPFRVGIPCTPAIFFSSIYVLTTLLNPAGEGGGEHGKKGYSPSCCVSVHISHRRNGKGIPAFSLCFFLRGHDEEGSKPSHHISIHTNTTRGGERGYLPSHRVFIRTDTTYLHTMRRGLPSSSNNYNKLFIMLLNYIVNTPGTRPIPRVTPRRTQPELLRYRL